jgi:hypothetical protein
MIVIPNNPDAGGSVNLNYVTQITKKTSESNYAPAVYEIHFWLEHRTVAWLYTTAIERDAAWSDIVTSSYCKMCGPVVV